LKLKRLSIFIVSIFFVSILSVNYYQLKNRIFQEDSLIVDIVDIDLDFSTCDVCQSPLTYRYVTSIIIPKDFSIPHILTFNFLTRAPPA
jgi:hypothetical protein